MSEARDDERATEWEEGGDLDFLKEALADTEEEYPTIRQLSTGFGPGAKEPIGFGPDVYEVGLPEAPHLRAAGFYNPNAYGPMQNPVYGIFVRQDKILCHTLATRGPNGITVLQVVTPAGGKPLYQRDLWPEGVTHIFGAVPFFSAQTLTWKLACMTFPKDQFGVAERAFWYEDTGLSL